MLVPGPLNLQQLMLVGFHPSINNKYSNWICGGHPLPLALGIFIVALEHNYNDALIAAVVLVVVGICVCGNFTWRSMLVLCGIVMVKFDWWRVTCKEVHLQLAFLIAPFITCRPVTPTIRIVFCTDDQQYKVCVRVAVVSTHHYSGGFTLSLRH